MEGELIAIAKEFGPWAFSGLAALILLRKEIGVLLMSGRASDRADGLMSQMVAQFAANLDMFKAVAGDVSDMKKTNAELLGVQRRVLEEMVRHK